MLTAPFTEPFTAGSTRNAMNLGNRRQSGEYRHRIRGPGGRAASISNGAMKPLYYLKINRSCILPGNACCNYRANTTDSLPCHRRYHDCRCHAAQQRSIWCLLPKANAGRSKFDKTEQSQGKRNCRIGLFDMAADPCLHTEKVKRLPASIIV